MPEIPPALIGTVGPGGVLLIIVMLVMLGRLVPRATHEDRVRDKDTQITYLQQTLAVRDEELKVRGQQVEKLMTQSDLTVQLLQSLAREAGARGDLAS